METQSITLPGESVPSDASQMSKTIGYYVVFIALGLVMASLGPTLPGLAKHTHTRLDKISFLFIARSSGFLLTALFGGRLYDRIQGHPVMAAGLGIMAVTIAIVPIVPLLWTLTVVFLITGIAAGMLDVGGNTLLVWVHQHKVGPFMNALHFFFGVGAFLSPIIIAQAVLLSGDITWAYWTLALLIFPVALWIASLPSPAPQRVSDEQEKGQIKYPLVALIGLFFFLYVGVEVGFGGWIFTYAIKLDLANETLAAYLTSAYWGALTIGRLLSIPLASRFKPALILSGNLAGCVLSMGIIILWSNSLVALWGGTFGLGFSLASTFPTMLSFSERRMTITGQITGWFFVGASLGGMSLPWLLGQLIESIGPRTMMVAIMMDLLATIAVFVLLLVYNNDIRLRSRRRIL